MKVVLDLPADVLEWYSKLSKEQRRSRKALLELVLIDKFSGSCNNKDVLSSEPIIDSVEAHNDEIYRKIKELKNEPIPPERNGSSYGRSSWNIEQNLKIEKLRQQLK